MVFFSDVYKEVIENGNLESYAEEHGEEIHYHGTETLVFYEDFSEDVIFLTLDFGEDFKTPKFLVLNSLDEDLIIYEDFNSAFEDFKERVDLQKNN